MGSILHPSSTPSQTGVSLVTDGLCYSVRTVQSDVMLYWLGNNDKKDSRHV